MFFHYTASKSDIVKKTHSDWLDVYMSEAKPWKNQPRLEKIEVSISCIDCEKMLSRLHRSLISLYWVTNTNLLCNQNLIHLCVEYYVF